jgi:hypothetical protein
MTPYLHVEHDDVMHEFVGFVHEDVDGNERVRETHSWSPFLQA